MPISDFFRINKLLIDRRRDARARSEGDDQSCGGDQDGGLPIPLDDPHVDLHPYEEQEKDETDGRDEVEEGEGGGGEDVLGETGDSTESGGAEDDPAYDF